MDLLTIFAQVFSIGPQKSLETNISKKAVCQLADNFPHSFLYYRVSQTLRNILLGSKSVPELFVTLQGHFCNTEEVVDNKNF